MKIWWNDKLVEEEQAVVSVYDHGFLYGMGLFETFRTYGGKPFLLRLHLERLAGGCRTLGICYQPDELKLREAVTMLLEANGWEDGYFRFTVTAGREALGLPAGDYEQPTVLLYAKPLPASARFEERARAIQRLETPRNTPEGGVRLKSLHYMNNLLGKRELAQYPWAAGAEGVFLDREGRLAEGIVSNLFYVQDGEVRTPSLDTGVLPGITRECILEICEEQGIPWREVLADWDELLEAEEVFLTNSIQELVPVHRLYEGDGTARKPRLPAPGPVTSRLYAHYTKRIGEECRDGWR
ncbi:4-amino-4-deoxychorismate lyase [Paenibacillus sp. J31TS4]|uniref:aminotransferase class IV n=1 Tax=Paenibacillus sp. J31TS4 TaxID=2807195 RepID=UPI001B1F10C2|nr:aminotransferase class IV [Paenibacillus sp. J31TS4]GIP41325.1 4-amino-4-deoxychorismate lyase [Paenibacillus sp. J31TS4]